MSLSAITCVMFLLAFFYPLILLFSHFCKCCSVILSLISGSSTFFVLATDNNINIEIDILYFMENQFYPHHQELICLHGAVHCCILFVNARAIWLLWCTKRNNDKKKPSVETAGKREEKNEQPTLPIDKEWFGKFGGYWTYCRKVGIVHEHFMDFYRKIMWSTSRFFINRSQWTRARSFITDKMSTNFRRMKLFINFRTKI